MKYEFGDIPMGLGMALAANVGALERYSALTDEQRAMVVARAAGVTSRSEMNAMVQELTVGKFPQ
ncbi:MAG: hypothetical protein ACOX81_03805 [Candidatus Heteroscillospira sp.]